MEIPYCENDFLVGDIFFSPLGEKKAELSYQFPVFVLSWNK